MPHADGGGDNAAQGESAARRRRLSALLPEAGVCNGARQVGKRVGSSENRGGLAGRRGETA
jgi:hypothetical protein